MSTSSTKVIARVVDPPVFYFRTEGDEDAGYRASVNVVGASDGDGGTAVGCFATDAGRSYDDVADYAGLVGADWWEAPAGSPARLVFAFDSHAGDGGFTTTLAATTSSATCASPPTVLDRAPGAADTARPFEQPRLSPSGNRVAYFRTIAGRATLATVGFDGKDARTIAPLRALPDGGPDENAGLPSEETIARPVWVNETTLAFLQGLDDDRWQILTVPDQASAQPTLLMSCTGAEPNQFDFLPNGDIIVSQATNPGSTAMVSNLVVYPITADTKACGPARKLTELTSVNGRSFARDFSLSPDKSRVAYHTKDDATGIEKIMVASVDGSSPPVSIAEPLAGAYRGPRWIGHGAFLTWGVSGGAFDAGVIGNAVAVIAADGGDARAVAFGSEGTDTVAIGNGGTGCSFGPAGSSMSLVGAATVFALRLLRRRRR